MGGEDQKSAQFTTLVIALALLAGCDHTEPFPPEQPANAPPRGGGNPIRLTYNPERDLQPRWLPDGSGFYYTVERNDRTDHDQCLARMAGSGGAIVELICDRSHTTDDSIATFEWAAVDVDERMAFVRTATPVVPPTLAPRTVELRLGSTSDPNGRLVRSFPYTASSGRIHQGLGWVQWLDPWHVMYVAQGVSYPSPCPGCPPDTVRVGLEVTAIDVATGTLQIVPGTDSANSVALAGSDTIYLTRESSGVIQRRVLSTGAVTIVHDFGIPIRDVTAGGGLLAAVNEFGGLWLLRPGTTPEVLFGSLPIIFARPSLSPDGRRLVVEGITSGEPDLWLFEIP